jgi:hypothetical protein
MMACFVPADCEDYNNMEAWKTSVATFIEILKRLSYKCDESYTDMVNGKQILVRNKALYCRLEYYLGHERQGHAGDLRNQLLSS